MLLLKIDEKVNTYLGMKTFYMFFFFLPNEKNQENGTRRKTDCECSFTSKKSETRHFVPHTV